MVSLRVSHIVRHPPTHGEGRPDLWLTSKFLSTWLDPVGQTTTQQTIGDIPDADIDEDEVRGEERVQAQTASPSKATATHTATKSADQADEMPDMDDIPDMSDEDDDATGGLVEEVEDDAAVVLPVATTGCAIRLPG